MEIININGMNYIYKEQFDVNLAIQYENTRWSAWHIIREFISNALDCVAGDALKVGISKENGFVKISDSGSGYPLVYALRIGASSKKKEEMSIGQFGEGIKMALLTCVRNKISVLLASQNWLIKPKVIKVEEDLEILAFDIFESPEKLKGSTVFIECTPEIEAMISNKDQLLLHFSSTTPLFGRMNAGVYSRGNQAKVFNKGVYIKDINALFSYGLSLSDLNRDRDLIDDNNLCLSIRDLWNTIDNPNLIKAYFKESNRAGKANSTSNYKEFYYCIYPEFDCIESWANTFYKLFGDKAVISTNDLASQETLHLGYIPVRLEHYGQRLAEYIRIKRDIDICRADYEFTWAASLTDRENRRLGFFRKVAELLEMDYPQDVKVFSAYAKSDNVMGIYSKDKDQVYLKQDTLNDNLLIAVDTFIHELNHKVTGADDYERAFADGLSKMAANLILKYTQTVGLPMTLKLTPRGFKLPMNFSYSATNLTSYIATIGSEIVIHTGGHVLSAFLPNLKIKPYSSERDVTFYKGSFYINIPSSIRDVLPDELIFLVTVNLEQI